MDHLQKTAKWIGALFIIGTAAGILSYVFLGTMFGDPDFLPRIAERPHQIVIGSLLILVMGFALAIIPALLFPVFRKTHEALALGAIIFRGALEAVVYMSQALLWLLMIPLSQQFIAADAASGPFFDLMAGVMIGADTMIAHVLSLVFSLGALMIYYMFFQTRLIPRWLSIWGLIGGMLYFASPLLGLLGTEAGFLMLPLAVQEMVLALWLIIKGFDPKALAV